MRAVKFCPYRCQAVSVSGPDTESRRAVTDTGKKRCRGVGMCKTDK